MRFDWDPEKAKRNRAKHGISFEEAVTVFDDPLYVDFFDPEHSDDENRFLRVGSSNQHRILLVSYTEREGRAQMISAREATKHERQAYEEN
jgi:uncharacterized DUF497 family protein